MRLLLFDLLISNIYKFILVNILFFKFNNFIYFMNVFNLIIINLILSKY